MENNFNQDNQQSSNLIPNQQSSSVDQDSISNTGPIGQTMQNAPASFVVNGDITDVGGQQVNHNILNQRADQISRTNTLPVYVVKLLASGVLTSLGALISMASGFTACETLRNKVECRKLSSALAFGAGFIIWSATAAAIVIKHRNRAQVRVHQVPSGDLPPPDHHILLGVPQNRGVQDRSSPSGGLSAPDHVILDGASNNYSHTGGARMSNQYQSSQQPSPRQVSSAQVTEGNSNTTSPQERV